MLKVNHRGHGEGTEDHGVFLRSYDGGKEMDSKR
jgi:hypothetical protein